MSSAGDASSGGGYVPVIPVASPKLIELNAGEEWRAEAAPSSQVASGETPEAWVRLITGNAEVFGAEMLPARAYSFAPSRGAARSVAVHSWYGAQLHVWGNVQHDYKSSETLMPMYASLHARLEARRTEAAARNASRPSGGAQPFAHGPHVLIVGPTDAGKSTLARILTSYACRVGRSPMSVDTDVGQGDVCVPGSLSAVPVDRTCVAVEDGFTGLVPLTYWFGSDTPSDSLPYFRACVTACASAVIARMDSDAGLAASGMVINTAGWIEDAGYDLILHAIREFKVDVVLVLGSEKVFTRLGEDVRSIALPVRPGADASEEAGKVISVVKMPRSEGVVSRSAEARRDARVARIRKYFYGPERPPGMPPALSPSTLTVGFDDVIVVRVDTTRVDSTMLAVDGESTLSPIRTVVVGIDEKALLNHVLGVSYATTEKQVPHSNVAGFVHVSAVNKETRTMTLLVPCPGPLPSRFLVQGKPGKITWRE